MSASVTRRFAATLLLLFAVGLTACSSDDGGTESAGDGTTVEASDDSGGDDGGFEPTVEQCEAVGSVPEDAAALDKTVASFPEELQDDVRQFGEDLAAYVTSFDDQTGEPSEPQPEPSEALAPVFETCSDLLATDDTTPAGGGEAAFTFGAIQVAGGSAVVSVSGECTDGTFPTEVELVYGPFSTVATASDLGGGEYEFTIDVADGATEAQLQDELGLDPESIESSITGTCG